MLSSTKRLAVLIPAYNVKYIEQAIVGLRYQTFRDFDVFISDDSVDNKITTLLAELESGSQLDGLNVTVISGPKDFLLNHTQLDALFSPKYEYVHFHLDDDYIYPTFYEQHLAAHSHGDFCVSVSQRWISNVNNIPFGRMIDVGFIDKNVKLFTPLTLEVLTKSCLPASINWLGELSNMVFKPKGETIFPPPPSLESNLNYFGLIDIGTCLELAQTRDIVFIASFNSNFRQHAEQSTHHHGLHGTRISRLCWAIYSIKAHNDNMISDADLQSGIKSAIRLIEVEAKIDKQLIEPLQIMYDLRESEEFKSTFTRWWLNYLRDDSGLLYERRQRLYDYCRMADETDFKI